MGHNEHTFDLNVNQVNKPNEDQEKCQIRKHHHLLVQKSKALMMHNPYAHVVNYLVLVDPKYVPDKDAFDESTCFVYN